MENISFELGLGTNVIVNLSVQLLKQLCYCLASDYYFLSQPFAVLSGHTQTRRDNQVLLVKKKATSVFYGVASSVIRSSHCFWQMSYKPFPSRTPLIGFSLQISKLFWFLFKILSLAGFVEMNFLSLICSSTEKTNLQCII